jgi:hypothetical protein
MSILQKLFIMLILVSALFTGFATVPKTHAADYTAVQDGNWDDPATWGGSVPTATDNVVIPGSRVIVIPNTLTVYREAGALTTINGFLRNEGLLNNSGVILDLGMFPNYGTLNNNGTFTNNFSFSNTGTFSNNGTFSTNAWFYNYNTVINAGTFDNYAPHVANSRFDNLAGATFTNLAGATLNNYYTISNYGTLDNEGMLNNYCGASIQEQPVSGNAINNVPCPACTMTAVAPSLMSSPHRTHTLDNTPNFSWSSVSGAESYRFMIYSEDHSFALKQRIFNTSYTLQSGEALAPGKYLWRVRTQDQVCGTWTAWSSRNTLFID